MLLLNSTLALSHETEIDHAAEEPDSLVTDRIKRERKAQENRSVLVAHKRNYLVPVAYARQPNNDPIDDIVEDAGDVLDDVEVQFQISLKAEIANEVFMESDAIFVGFTLRAFWQAYNNDISSPFRETNYEPEVFWVTPVPWKILGSDATLFALGISHQSNGRSQPFSRSWNRIYANFIWERNRYVFSFKPWLRIEEDEKDDPLDADGDDNPDIEDYLGNFEFSVVYRKNHHEFSMMLRNNLDSEENRGAIQLDWTFPFHKRIRGYAQFFNGYGESLIDYDAHIERIGIGILLSDLL